MVVKSGVLSPTKNSQNGPNTSWYFAKFCKSNFRIWNQQQLTTQSRKACLATPNQVMKKQKYKNWNIGKNQQNHRVDWIAILQTE